MDVQLPEREESVALHTPVHPVRFVTATPCFDGHDVAVNIMRRTGLPPKG